MIRKIDSTKVTLVVGLLMSFGATQMYFQPEKQRAQSAPIFGVSNADSLTEELTSISQMPFLSTRTAYQTLDKVVISDDIFYTPKERPVEQVEEVAVAEVAVEEYLPVGIVPPEPDYAIWAESNLKLQSVTNAGVIINDTFYKPGNFIKVHHQFDDGSYFTALIKRTEGKVAVIEINKGILVNLTLGGGHG